MAEQFKQAEQQQVGRDPPSRAAENTTPKKLQEKRKRTAKTMPAPKKLRVKNTKRKQEKKIKKKEKKRKEMKGTLC